MKIDLQINERQMESLINKLRNISPKLSKKILREESRRAAKTHLLGPAKSRVPKRTGRLSKALKIVAIKRTRTAVGVRLALSSKKWPANKAFYGGFVEYGTPKRNISGVHFLRRTANDNGNAAANDFLRAVQRRIDEVI
jgi:HK97 gp10 family phage protein